MKFLVVLLLIAVASASPDCGCLKCSKHVAVAGQVLAEPRYCGPVKIIYRGDKGPFDSLPDKPIPTCRGFTHGYTLHAYPVSSVLPHCGQPCQHPITVQKPVTIPNVLRCVPLVGLKACVDRVVLPAPDCCKRPCYDEPPKVECARGPLLEAISTSDYDHYCPRCCRYKRATSNNLETNTQINPHTNCTSRLKRQVPFLNHGYKFFVNMLPPFLKDTVKNVVNTMALTHPDKKLQRIYNIQPPLSLQEKLNLKHKENIAKLRRKFHGKTDATYNVYNNFNDIDDYSVNIPNILTTSTYSKYPWMSSRFNNDISAEVITEQWLNEMKTGEVVDHSEVSSHPKKSWLIDRLKTLNKGLKKNNPKEKIRKKRTIIMDSDKLSPPIYRIKIEDSAEDHEIDLRRRNDHYVSSKNPRRAKHYDYHDPREEMLTKAIRKELQNFKRVDGREQSQFHYDRMPPYSPIFHLLTLPIKFLTSLGDTTKPGLPIIGTLPRMLIGTKRYLRDFGKNLHKNILHFTSDIIGDFTHHGPADDILNPINNARFSRRFRRSVDSQEDCKGEDATGKNRQKRSFIKIVEEKEVEQFLKEKLGRMYNIPISDNGYSSPNNRRYPTEYNSEEMTGHYPKHYRHDDYDDDDISEEHHKSKVVLEKVRPKVIIDNNGLPFMEMDGFKRPLLMKGLKPARMSQDRVGSSSPITHDTSDEANFEKISDVIHQAKNPKKPNKNTEAPIKVLKKKISDLLYETDMLVHLDLKKYDAIYDDMLEIQYIKNSVVQDWKRVIIDKRINDYNAKIQILEKFKAMQSIKDITIKMIADVLYKESENSFVLKNMVKILARLQKLQCLINQVVGCFEEKFKMGSKFDTKNEIKFVDFLNGLNFASARTRNGMIAKLHSERDNQLQENIKLIDKLKESIGSYDDETILEEANLLWEMKNIEKMLRTNIEEMHQNLEDGYSIKKNLKILFHLTKRLQSCGNEQIKLHAKYQKERDIINVKSIENEEENDSSEGNEKKKKTKKFNMEEFKQKLQDRISKNKELLQQRREKVQKKYQSTSKET